MGILKSISLWLILLALPVPAIAIQKKYTVAFPVENFIPQYYQENKQMAGFLPAVLNEFAKIKGYKFVFQSLPIKRYQILVAQGKIDFLCPANPLWSDQSIKGVKFSDKIMQSRTGFIRHKKNIGKPMRAIVSVNGYTLPTIPDSLQIPIASIQRTQDMEGSLKMLIAGRADAAYVHLDFAAQWLKRNKISANLKFDKAAGYEDYSYHLATTKHLQILVAFNQWMQEHQKTIFNLSRKYGIGLREFD